MKKFLLLLVVFFCLFQSTSWSQSISNIYIAGVTIPPNNPVCAGSNVTINYTVTTSNGHPISGNVTISLINNSTNQSINITPSPIPTVSVPKKSSENFNNTATIPATLPAGQYRVSVSVGGLTTLSGTFQVIAKPVVMLNPGNTTICNGSSTNISGTITATGNWTLTLSDGQTATGTGNGPFSFTVSPTTNTTYTITNLSGADCLPAILPTNNVVVNVFQPSNGGIISGNNSSVCTGTNSTTLTVSGAVGNIAWQFLNPATSTWDPVPGSTTSNTITVSNLIQTTSYRVEAQSGSGCASATSPTYTVTVNPIATLSSSGSLTQNLCQNSAMSPVTFTTGAGATGLQLKSGTLPAGIIFNSSTKTLSGSTNATGNFILVFETTGSPCPVEETVSIIVAPPAQVGAGNPLTSSLSTTCLNSPVTLNFNTAGMVGFIQKWEYAELSGSAYGPWTEIANTTNSLTHTLNATTKFQVVIAGCGNLAYSNEVEVIVTSGPEGGVVNGGSTICSDNSAYTLSLSGQSGNILRWEYSSDGVSGWSSISSTNPILARSFITQSGFYRVVLGMSGCSPAYSSAAEVIINPAPNVGTLNTLPSNTPTTVCASSNSTDLKLTGQTGTIDEWQKSEDGGTTWTSIPNTQFDTYNTGNLNVTTQFRVKIAAVAPCSPVYTQPFSIAVVPLINNTISGAATICKGSSPGTLSGTVSGGTGTYIYQWEKSTTGNSSGFTPISGATSASYATGNLFQTTWFKRVVTSGICSEPGNVIEITIPTINNNLTVPFTQAQCPGYVLPTNGIDGTTVPSSTYRWQTSYNAGLSGWTDIGTTEDYSDAPITYNYDAWYRRITAYPVGSTTCYDTSNVAYINISSVDGTIRPSAATICVGDYLQLFGDPSDNLLNADFANSGTYFKIPSSNTFEQFRRTKNGESPWSSPIFSNAGSNQFFGMAATTSGTANSYIISDVFVSVPAGQPVIYLQLQHTYHFASPATDYIEIEYSKDNGATWVLAKKYTGADFGLPNAFGSDQFILGNNFSPSDQVKLRLHYVGSAGSYWAFDNIIASNVKNLTPEFHWYSSSPDLGIFTNNTGTGYNNTTTTGSVWVKSNVAGVYTVSVMPKNATCLSPNTSTITVIDKPIITSAIATTPNICVGSGVQVNLGGLTANRTYQVNYSIGTANYVATTTLPAGTTPITSDGSGNASFTTVTITPAMAGQTITVTGVQFVGYASACLTSNSFVIGTIMAQPNPVITTTPTCDASGSDISVSGLVPNSTTIIKYTLTGGALQTTSPITVSSAGVGTFKTIGIPTSVTAITISISEIITTVGASTCTTVFATAISSPIVQLSNFKFYRSRGTGNWTNVANWEINPTSVNATTGWVAACSYPTDVNSDEVVIRNGNTITLDIDLSIDKTTIDIGGTLETVSAAKFTVLNTNGNGLADFIINGTYKDRSSSTNSLALPSGATWTMGTQATVIKTNNGSVNVYKDNYETGIANIPASANWIYLFNNDGPTVTVTAVGMYYPNLTFVSTSGAYQWKDDGLKVLKGGSASMIVKGNLVVGSDAANPVVVQYANFNITPLTVMGNVTVNNGSIFTNELLSGTANSDYGVGTGLNVKGNVVVNGTLNLSGGSANKGELIFSGTSAQSITGTNTGDPSSNMIAFNVTNANTSGVDVQKTFKVTGTLTLNDNTPLRLGNNGDIIIASSATGTARVAPINTATISYPGIGRFIVERYIAYGQNWQFLATNTKGSTLREAWMENGNIIPGYGAWLGAVSGSTGFDIPNSPQNYVKWFNGIDHEINGWTGVTNALQDFHNYRGLMSFIRGDRTVVAPGTPKPTTLRSRGTIDVGEVKTNLGIAADKFTSFGNPYPSSIDFTDFLSINNGIESSFNVWDPIPTGRYGVGRYVSVVKVGSGYEISSPTTLYPANTDGMIQSGQAFFIKATPTGGNSNITFRESNKMPGSRAMRRGPNTIPIIKTFMYRSEAIVDGNLVYFHKDFSNDIDKYDASKLFNTGENIYMRRNNRNLVGEGRSGIAETDTIFYALSNMQKAKYELEFAPSDFDNENAYLIDKFLKKATAINLKDTVRYAFEVTDDASSKNADRFYLIFRLKKFDFTNAKAERNNDRSVTLNWAVNYPQDVQKYAYMRTDADGKTLEVNDLTELVAIDRQASDKTATYQVMAYLTSGEMVMSKPFFIGELDKTSFIRVINNPVTNKKLSLEFRNATAGRYNIQLLNALGQQVINQQANISGFIQELVPVKISGVTAAGTYFIKVYNGKDVLKTEKIIIK